MIVLHVLNTNRFSGAENVACQIISLVRNEENIEPVYCCPDGKIKDVLLEKNINFEPIKTLNFFELRRIITKLKPAIIHAHDMYASFVASLVCGNIPLISHIHNNNYNSRVFSMKSIAYLFAGMRAAKIFWVSESSFNGYIFNRLLKNKSEILYNVVNINEIYNKMNMDEKKYDYEIVYLGRLAYEKNPQMLMRVFSKVAYKIPNVKIAVIGSGELECEIKLLCNDLGIQDNVSFMGFKENPLKILSDSKVMVMTSRWEGTPMCALEAMALGVPIVGTPVDGLKYLVVNGKTGFLSNDIDVLAEEIVQILKNDKKYQEFSVNTNKRFEELVSINDYKSRITKTYYSLTKDSLR